MNKQTAQLLEQHFDTAFAAPDLPAGKAGVPYELPQGWEWVRLGEVGITQTGTTPPSKDRENYGDYIPFVGPGDIKNGCIDYSGEGLSEQGLSKGRLIDANSVLMVCIGGSIGKHAINDRDTTCNQQINTLTPYSPIPVKYIYGVMAAVYFQNAVISQAGGSATPIINKQKWSGIPAPIPLPPRTAPHCRPHRPVDGPVRHAGPADRRRHRKTNCTAQRRDGLPVGRHGSGIGECHVRSDPQTRRDGAVLRQFIDRGSRLHIQHRRYNHE